MQNLELRGGRKKLQKLLPIGRMDMIFFPVKAEIEEKKMVEISTGNTPEISTGNTSKSPDFQGKCTFFREISKLKIEVVEISGGNKNLKFEKFGSRRCVSHLESISLLKNSLLWPQAKLANICIFQRKYKSIDVLIFPLKKCRFPLTSPDATTASF